MFYLVINSTLLNRLFANVTDNDKQKIGIWRDGEKCQVIWQSGACVCGLGV